MLTTFQIEEGKKKKIKKDKQCKTIPFFTQVNEEAKMSLFTAFHMY